ncbi:NAD(P)-dependent oxidoreductase [Bacteroidia bacterium]|nr:NAD(P)-dependent oxidoreductase [Bacteroidia bacterium]
MQKILITGANGQLGKSLKDAFGCDNLYKVFYTDVDNLDLTDFEAVDDFVKNNKINIIVNCAAYTAVDKAENDEKMATLLNSNVVANLAEIAVKYNVFLIHISTDYVFNGENYKPYSELDMVSPVSIYGRTKLEGEQMLKNVKKAIVIRTSWLFSKYGNNFVFTMQKLSKERSEINVVCDQVGTPTYAGHLADAIKNIILQLNDWNDGMQVYHFSNEGACSWYDFAKEIIEKTNPNCKVNPIETKDYPTTATRPFYSVLNKTKIKKRFELTIPHWKDGLKEVIGN